ncbi:MAG: hypothetical protein PF442_06670, partial [Desulfobulbaceae bacterium]|nr:hypothetical protein [Desulfobulbaceae bacterium]
PPAKQYETVFSFIFSLLIERFCKQYLSQLLLRHTPAGGYQAGRGNRLRKVHPLLFCHPHLHHNEKQTMILHKT